ncbi:MAG: Ig-like domain-containing protein, partial [Gemmatimonadaceae bacterium]
TGAVGQPLAEPIVVQVTDQSGNTLSGVAVTWTVVSGGGSVSTSASTTDANGNASVVWTLGNASGTQQLSASIVTGASATISATATPAAAAGMSIASGNNQTIAIGATSAPMVVHIADQFGNPIAGVTVNWATSGGMLSAASNATDANGDASVTLSTNGVVPASLPAVFTVTASSGALASQTFTITAE